MKWKKGRGKLDLFNPLIGIWQSETDSAMGRVKCRREFSRILSGKYIQLTADWETASGSYNELALIGVSPEKEICFWSFTSDGRHSEGRLTDVSDVHPEAVGFEAQMPAGLARMIYWPDDISGFLWAVESKSKKGWNRFTKHHYLPVKVKKK